MQFFMLGQVTFLREGFPTRLARVRTLTSMDFKMVKDVPSLRELFPTTVVIASYDFVHPLSRFVVGMCGAAGVPLQLFIRRVRILT